MSVERLSSFSAWSAPRTVRSEAYRADPTPERVQQLLSKHPFPDRDRFGCYRIPDHSPYSDLARGLECTVFEEHFGNDPEVMTAAYGPYEAASFFFLVVDRAAMAAVGVLRAITP